MAAGLLVGAGAAPACKGTKAPTASGPPVEVTIMPAAYDEHSDTPLAIKDKCKFHEATPGSSLTTGPHSNVLSMTVVTMKGVESDWTGESMVIVRGELRDSGTLVGSFRVRYSEVPGVVGGMTGRCQALDDIASYMVEDIVPWLRDPSPGAEMGE